MTQHQELVGSLDDAIERLTEAVVLLARVRAEVSLMTLGPNRSLLDQVDRIKKSVRAEEERP